MAAVAMPGKMIVSRWITDLRQVFELFAWYLDSHFPGSSKLESYAMDEGG